MKYNNYLVNYKVRQAPRGRGPEASAKRFIKRLLYDENPNKGNYQNLFNKIIAPKKDILAYETVKEINDAWRLKFNETEM